MPGRLIFIVGAFDLHNIRDWPVHRPARPDSQPIEEDPISQSVLRKGQMVPFRKWPLPDHAVSCRATDVRRRYTAAPRRGPLTIQDLVSTVVRVGLNADRRFDNVETRGS